MVFVDLRIMALSKSEKWGHLSLLPALDDNTLYVPTDLCGTSVNASPGNDGPLSGISLVKTLLLSSITSVKQSLPSPDKDASVNCFCLYLSN